LALSGSAQIGVDFGGTTIYDHLFSSGFGYTEFTFNVSFAKLCLVGRTSSFRFASDLVEN